MKEEITASSCNCQHTNVAAPPLPQEKNTAKGRAVLKSASSVLLSFLIAFFPKCPVCWAAYMSLFGSFGLSQLPYMKWILPALLGFLALHLYLLLRKVRTKGYGPFLLSIAGAAIVLAARSVFTNQQWMLFAGMSLILAGSLWNSFSGVGARRVAG